MGNATQPNRFERVDDRGRFVEVLAEGTWETVIYGQMNPGAVIGNHYHKLTKIYFYLTSGSADIELLRVADGSRRGLALRAGEGIFLETGEAHAIRFREASEFSLVKSRRHDPADTYACEVTTV